MTRYVVVEVLDDKERPRYVFTTQQAADTACDLLSLEHDKTYYVTEVAYIDK